jgi:hypothetical protein
VRNAFGTEVKAGLGSDVVALACMTCGVPKHASSDAKERDSALHGDLPLSPDALIH